MNASLALVNAYVDTTIGHLLAEAEIFVDGDWVESKDQDPSGDVRLIQLADIGDGCYLSKSSRFLTSEKARELRCTFLQPGDILVARMPEPLGRACIFPGDTKNAVTVVDVCIIRIDNRHIDAKWLVHAINSPIIRQRISEYVSGTTRQRISRGNLAKIKISVPPLAEQRRISAILDKADALRIQRREAISKLDQLLHSVFWDIFGDPTKNPKGWEVATVADVAEVQGGLQLSASRQSITTSAPYLRVANVYRGCLNLSEIKVMGATPAEIKRTALVAGDILVVEGHGNPDEIGRCAIWDGSIKGCIHQNHLIRVRANTERIIPSYLASYLNSEVGSRELKGSARTTSGLNTISVSKVRQAEILLPPLQVQERWSAFTLKISAQHATSDNAARKADALFAALQAQAFYGMH